MNLKKVMAVLTALVISVTVPTPVLANNTMLFQQQDQSQDQSVDDTQTTEYTRNVYTYKKKPISATWINGTMFEEMEVKEEDFLMIDIKLADENKTSVLTIEDTKQSVIFTQELSKENHTVTLKYSQIKQIIDAKSAIVKVTNGLLSYINITYDMRNGKIYENSELNNTELKVTENTALDRMRMADYITVATKGTKVTVTDSEGSKEAPVENGFAYFKADTLKITDSVTFASDAPITKIKTKWSGSMQSEDGFPSYADLSAEMLDLDSLRPGDKLVVTTTGHTCLKSEERGKVMLYDLGYSNGTGQVKKIDDNNTVTFELTAYDIAQMKNEMIVYDGVINSACFVITNCDDFGIEKVDLIQTEPTQSDTAQKKTNQKILFSIGSSSDMIFNSKYKCIDYNENLTLLDFGKSSLEGIKAGDRITVSAAPCVDSDEEDRDSTVRIANGKEETIMEQKVTAKQKEYTFVLTEEMVQNLLNNCTPFLQSLSYAVDVENPMNALIVNGKNVNITKIILSKNIIESIDSIPSEEVKDVQLVEGQSFPKLPNLDISKMKINGETPADSYITNAHFAWAKYDKDDSLKYVPVAAKEKVQADTDYKIVAYFQGKSEAQLSSDLISKVANWTKLYQNAKYDAAVFVYGKEYTADMTGAISSVNEAESAATSIGLSWKKVDGVDGYVISKYDTAKKKYVKLATTSKTTYTAKKLKADTQYRFEIKAYRKIGNNVVYGNSQTCSAYTTPLALTNLKITSAKKQAVLTWKKSATKDVTYVIYMKNATNGKEKLVGATKGTRFTMTGLSSGKKYSFEIKTVKKHGKETYTAAGVKKSVTVK